MRAAQLMHGKTSAVEHDGRRLFAGLPSPMTCTRYHSLIVAEEGLPGELEVTARVQNGNSKGTIMGLRHRAFPIHGVQFHPEFQSKPSRAHPLFAAFMGLRHRRFPIEGVQFHPESVLTVDGKSLIRNFLSL